MEDGIAKLYRKIKAACAKEASGGFRPRRKRRKKSRKGKNQ
jgi:hypothetical protein